MFSVLRAAEESDVNSIILMIVDQQHIDPSIFNKKVLPRNVQVNFIYRNNIRKLVDGSPVGHFFRLLASLNIKTNSSFRSRYRKWLLNTLSQELCLTQLPSKLVLFNDRSRVARLFRLAFRDYEVIEDGISNYSGVQLKPLESTWRFLTGHKLKKRYIGDDKRCKRIYLLNPENAPDAIREKTEKINFLNPARVSGICSSFFGLKSDAIKEGTLYIIATQPITAGNLTGSNFDLVIYGKVVEFLKNQGISPAFKVHPRESMNRYQEAFPDLQMVESKIPLELLIFGNESKCNIISVYSTAGMGFEKFCNRLTLIADDESERMAEVFDNWRASEKALDERVFHTLVKNVGL